MCSVSYSAYNKLVRVLDPQKHNFFFQTFFGKSCTMPLSNLLQTKIKVNRVVIFMIRISGQRLYKRKTQSSIELVITLKPTLTCDLEGQCSVVH